MNAILAFILRLLLVLLAYLFVGWISFLIYTDIKGHGKIGFAKPIPPIFFNLMDENETSVHEYSKSEIILGRDPACDLPLKDDRISMRHCRVTYYRNHWWIEDLGSTNGTYLNNSMITTSTILMNGDNLRLGHQEIQVKIG
jgi:pSer/pThr/pTyr-binding forkhead associated (FHA) protein